MDFKTKTSFFQEKVKVESDFCNVQDFSIHCIISLFYLVDRMSKLSRASTEQSLLIGHEEG